MRYQLHALICICSSSDRGAILANQFRLKIVLERATRNSKTRRALTLKTQTRPNSSSKKPEKLVLLEPKLEMLEQKSILIHARTR